MKIIVTGGQGYIGSKLVPYLANLGHDITVIDCEYFGQNLFVHPNVVVKNVNIFDTVVADYQHVDAVIHLAGLSNDPMANFNPADNYVQNLASTAFLAYTAKQAGVSKFIFAGSCSVYGKNPDDVLTEESEPGCDFPYGLSKLQAERSLLHLADERFQIVVLRQATVFGWAPRMRTDLVVNTMTKTAVLENKIYVNAPALSRPLIHVDDLCQVYQKILEQNNAPQVINVSMHNHTLIEIANMVQQSISKHLGNVVVETKNISDLRSYKVDNSLMLSTVGSWEPITVTQAVDELISYLPVDNKILWADPNFLNIEVYKQRFNKG
jgi:nucleoside-diphosphate-sugar epimerase